MRFNWNNVKPTCCARWLVLPTVYSDSLSYGEQLDKFCYQLNQLIENNNIIPDFIAEMIKEYIDSGAIGEVVRDILADYILNVKYPPEGITPAVGDGSSDDTAAIQGCIDYAAENGGVVYFPYGSYLTQPVTVKDGVSLFGFDRYSTKIVLKGGATKPLIGGTVADLSIANLTLDGNSGIQVNNVNVVTIIGTNVLFTNLIIKDGYTLVNYVGNGGHFQISDVVFGNAVEKCLLTAGNADVQCENVVFNKLSAVGGVCVVDIGTNNGMFEFSSFATCDKCVVINGNNNNIVANIENATTNFVDNGANNNINIIAKEIKQYVSGNKNVTTSGEFEETVGGKKTVSVTGGFEETVGGNKTVSVTGEFDETVGGKKTVSVTGEFAETVGGDKTINVSGKLTETVTNNKEITVHGNATKHIEGIYTKTVDGDATETYKGAHSKTVTAFSREKYNDDRIITENNVTENAKKVVKNVGDLQINSKNPVAYNHAPSKYNMYFDYIPMRDFDDVGYNVLVANEKTNDLVNGTFVNVKDFGAVGDALFFNKANNTYWKDSSFTIRPTNDVTAFENAIQYAEDNNIGTIFIPDGSYYLPNKSFTINTSKVRFVGENKTKLVSVGLTEGCFIALSSDVTLDMYSYARMPLENICLSGSYFTDEEKEGVCGLSFGYGADKPSTIISPHIAIKNVTIQYFAVGVELASAYKSVAYNLNIIACNLGILIPNTINAIIPYNIYGAHVECCNWGIYTLAGGYSELNIFGGAFEYNRGIYTGTSKTAFYGVRFESDLTASCTKELTARNVLIVSGSLTPYARFIGCNFLFLPNYVDNVSYWINNPYKLSSWGDTTVIAGYAKPFTGAYDFNFESCEFSTDQYTTTSVYFVSGNKIYANGCSLLGGLNKNYFFNPAQLVSSKNGIVE